MNLCMYGCTGVHLYACMCACMCMCMHLLLCIHFRTHYIYICECVCVIQGMYANVYVNIYVHVCMYICVYVFSLYICMLCVLVESLLLTTETGSKGHHENFLIK